ncbi:MAG: beta-lactamase family protein [Oscillospiraceae bacterium]|jgi:CubicO group peptidase (beta-lactamase class C family)|nr:beta-lactamase family protein [Oscillospiraceae bacterium]
MRNKDGRAGIVIVILAAIIVIALLPWYFIISRNLGFDLSGLWDSLSFETSVDGDDELNDGEEPDDDPALPPTPEPTSTPQTIGEPGYIIPLDETIISIAAEYPQLINEINEVLRRYDCVAAGLTAFNGETGEFFNFDFGYADLEARQPANDQTKFRISSLTKLVTVICAMSLVDQNLLDLDTDISIYLGYEAINSNFPDEVITPRMLMQHTSSIFDSGAFQTSRDRNSSESLRYLLERGTSFRRNQPGSVYEYSDFGYSVLGAICENVAGKSIDIFAREILFEPLGIDAGYVPGNIQNIEDIAVIYNESHAVTRSVQSQLDITQSDLLGHDLHLSQGNLTISALDYSRILAMLGNGGVLRDIRVLSSEAVREIYNIGRGTVANDQGFAMRYTLDDFLPGDGFFWNGGSAYGLFAQFFYSDARNTNKGIVVITTGATVSREPNEMIDVCTEVSAIVWRALLLSGADNTQSNNGQSDD